MPDSVAIQRKFFDRYLKGENNDWEREPRVEVWVRGLNDSVKRVVTGKEWPLETTKWTKLYLDAEKKSLEWAPPAAEGSASYPALSEGVVFSSAPLDRDLEFGGPIKAKLFVACDKPDMDLFLTLQGFDPAGAEVTFFAADEPKLPISQGWLRVTQRKLDEKRTTEWMPWHTHEKNEPLTPGEVYEVDVEIWPASVSLPKGSRIALRVQGKDFERADAVGPLKGSGLFTHTDPTDRAPERINGTHTAHTGGARASYLLLPVV
jgi:predicted acyl esterase